MKFFILILLAAVLVFLLVKYHSYLLFWKYNINQISSEISSSKAIENRQDRIARLTGALEMSSGYISDNALEKEGYFMRAKALSELGEAESDLYFSTYVIRESSVAFSSRSKELFFDALRALKKGVALDERQVLSDELLILMAKLLLYSGYGEVEDIYGYVEQLAEPERLQNIENRRFYGLINVLQGDVEEGIRFLRRFGGIKTPEDKLFLGGAYKKAGQYTDAIVLYKELLNGDGLAQYEVLIRLSLGEIYFEQSLYNEALEQLLKLQLIAPSNIQARHLTGEVYLKLGDKKSADAYLK